MRRFSLLALFLAFFAAIGSGLSQWQAYSSASAAVAEIRLDVNYEHDWANAHTDPNTEVTVTVKRNGSLKGTVTGQTDSNGDLWTGDLNWNPQTPNFLPGDAVKAVANGAEAEIKPVGSISSDIDVDNDTISGIIKNTGQPTVTVDCWVWKDNDNPSRQVKNVNGANGAFTCDFSTGDPIYDIQPEDHWAVQYSEDDGDSVMRFFSPPWARVNYSHDWAGINYEEGHLFTFTLKDSAGTVKDIATGETSPDGGWGGPGYETRYDDWASGANPDFMPGDSVLFESDDGYSKTLRVGTINGNLDAAADKVDGTLKVPWLSGKLPVECDIWVEGGGAPGRESEATANGSTPYECDWSGEWDILPGHQVAVMYVEPDSDRIIRVFEENAPDLHVDKGSEGSDEAAPGGRNIFRINISNNGGADSGTISITDTLPVGMSYVADNLGVAPTFDGNKVIWQANELKADSGMRFYLVTENSASNGDTLTNKVDVSVNFDTDPNNDHGEAELRISAGDPNLYVDLGAHPGDPVPGETFLYQINYGNEHGTPSGQTVIELELPDVSTFVEWESREGYDLWQGSVVNDVLTLTAPAVPGHWGDELLVRVRLDSGLPGDECFYAHVEIDTANDPDLGNNESETDNCVGEPRAGAEVYKRMHWGETFPGGIVEYGISLGNNGNVATKTTLMDTIPLGSSFEGSWVNEGGVHVPFPPDTYSDGVVTWKLGKVEPGVWSDFIVRVQVDRDAQPGRPFVNCALAEIADPDVQPFDNESCVYDTLQPPGANLRINKEHYWHGGETGLEYGIEIKNLGSTTLENVEVIDTYPEGVTFNDEWWHDFWENVKLIEHDASQRRLVWRISRIEPSWAFNIGFNVELDGNKIGVEGLTFGNFVEAPIDADINPDDNYATDLATTGPDLYIRKWMQEWDQIVTPGDEVAFVVEFGNASHRWGTNGNTVIEDLLPDGMKFVRASDPWNYYQDWDPIQDGNELNWFLGNLNNDERHFFEITAKVQQNVDLGEILTNQIEIYSTDSGDKDPLPENNMDYEAVRVGKFIYLPLTVGP